MGLTIKKGYLIKQQDYELFDEILTFICGDGKRYHIYAPGVRKITSKNSRSLFYGNYLEFEFFASRFDQKLSKLKKVTTLSNVSFAVSHHPSLDLISETLALVPDFNEEDFEFYQKILNYILLNTPTSLINSWIYLFFLTRAKILPYHSYQTCFHQHAPQVGFDLTTCAFVCQHCLSVNTVLLEPSTITIFKQLLSYHDENDFNHFEQNWWVIEHLLKKLFQRSWKAIYGSQPTQS